MASQEINEKVDLRYQQLSQWLNEVSQAKILAINALAGDASFRRYFRVITTQGSSIAMDAPPEKEDSHSFLAVADCYHQYGINAPTVYAQDLEAGFILLSDFGDELLLYALRRGNPLALYQQAIVDLIEIQKIQQNKNYYFAPFDKKPISLELTNFKEWFLQKFMGLSLSSEEEILLSNVFNFLVDNAMNQPQVCIHRDYHSRNLLLLENGRLGIIDFQDAMWGPLTYDLVSLIRDCYIAWPKELVDELAKFYFRLAIEKNVLSDSIDIEQFTQWFDLMGIQRHLKAIFIFARKFLRDDSRDYLADIPRALNYVNDVLQHYPNLLEFNFFLKNRVLSSLNERMKQ